MMERPGRDPAPAALAGRPTLGRGSASPGGCWPWGFSPGVGRGMGEQLPPGSHHSWAEPGPGGFVFTPHQQLKQRMIKVQRG